MDPVLITQYFAIGVSVWFFTWGINRVWLTTKSLFS